MHIESADIAAPRRTANVCLEAFLIARHSLPSNATTASPATKT